MGKPHEQRDAWKFLMELAKAMYQMIATFPAEERDGLPQQMRRAAVSIPSNIAEGTGRHGVKEYLHFIGVARGYLAELETQLQRAGILGFTTAVHAAFDFTDRVGKLLTGLHEKWSAA